MVVLGEGAGTSIYLYRYGALHSGTLCAAVEGMVLRWFSQEWIIHVEIIQQFWSRIGYNLLEKCPV